MRAAVSAGLTRCRRCAPTGTTLRTPPRLDGRLSRYSTQGCRTRDPGPLRADDGRARPGGRAASRAPCLRLAATPRRPRALGTLALEAEGSADVEHIGSALELAAVTHFRAGVECLQAERLRQGLTLRQLSARTGVALSALTGMEQGSAWPTFPVLARAAWALDQRVQVRDTAVDIDWARAELLWLQLGDLRAGWHQFVILQLLHRDAARGLSFREAARQTGLNRDTIRELAEYNAPHTWASTRVLFALAAFYGTALEVVPRSEPWPLTARAE